MSIERNDSARVSDFSSSNEEAIIEQIHAEAHREVLREILATDLVARSCVYVHFVSCSNGRKRSARKPRKVELYSRKDGKFRSIKNGGAYGGLDKDATEILGDTVDPSEATQTFIERLRGLG